MKTFNQLLSEIFDAKGYRNNPIPVGAHDSDNIGHIVSHIERNVSKGKETKEIHPSKMVADGTLKSTQDYLYKHGGGEPVFKKLKHPVLFKDAEDVHHIIDGHHRVANAFEKGRTIQAHIFSK